jgi:hypothetical protein
MYRIGFGDCFLLRFLGGERDHHILIDCGTLSKSKSEVHKIVSDLIATLPQIDGHSHLDVLVLTHEHWDHLSGLASAKALFDQLDVGQVWLAWTENPDDADARRLDRAKTLALSALTRIRASMAGGGRNDESSRAMLDNVLAFYGGPAALGADSGRGTRPIREFVRTRWGAERTRYLEPGGAVMDLPGFESVSVYVLGPPREPEKLRRSNPSKRAPETYGLALYPDSESGHVAALACHLHATLDTSEKRSFVEALPFDYGHPLRLNTKNALRHPFFAQNYFAESSEVAHRQIEDDWLGGPELLALKLDNHTNNTSLALAFELRPSGKVLLFPGDAQVGNWLSWHDLVWPPNADPAAPMTTTARALLERTVFYKVGHHGSHNATLQALGLDLMTSPELVAAIPVDSQFAGESKGWHEIPFEPLLEALRERTGGRVLRADDPLVESSSLTPVSKSLKVKQVEESEYRPNNIVCNALWVEHRIEY